jgi:3-methylcrotonyl-CoA carboxylase alpha subunit
MRAALAQFEVAGVTTNIEFLSRLMSAPSFVEGRLDTALIERERAHWFAPQDSVPRIAWDLAVLALARHRSPSKTNTSPWATSDGWCLGIRGQQHWKFRSGDSVVAAGVAFREAGVEVAIAGSIHTVEGHLAPDGRLSATIDGAAVSARARTFGNVTHLFLDGQHHILEWLDPYLPSEEGADRHGGLVAPMPGRIIAVLAKAGDSVARGAPLIVMEAMKMEHTITAPSAGVIDKVLCAVGEQVKEGVELLQLARPPT